MWVISKLIATVHVMGCCFWLWKVPAACRAPRGSPRAPASLRICVILPCLLLLHATGRACARRRAAASLRSVATGYWARVTGGAQVVAAGAFADTEQAREMIDEFLDGLTWGHEPRTNLDTPKGKMEAYVLSVYLAAMTLTTVGYRDI